MDSATDNNSYRGRGRNMDALRDAEGIWTRLKRLELEEWAAIASVISIMVFAVVIGLHFGR
jgi:hypothetical protein